MAAASTSQGRYVPSQTPPTTSFPPHTPPSPPPPRFHGAQPRWSLSRSLTMCLLNELAPGFRVYTHTWFEYEFMRLCVSAKVLYCCPCRICTTLGDGEAHSHLHTPTHPHLRDKTQQQPQYMHSDFEAHIKHGVTFTLSTISTTTTTTSSFTTTPTTITGIFGNEKHPSAPPGISLVHHAGSSRRHDSLNLISFLHTFASRVPARQCQWCVHVCVFAPMCVCARARWRQMRVASGRVSAPWPASASP